jgi:hypothetical protein
LTVILSLQVGRLCADDCISLARGREKVEGEKKKKAGQLEHCVAK